MAYFELYRTYDDRFRFYLHLSSPFNKDNYSSAGITRYPFTGSSSSIGGIVGSKNAPSSGTSTRVTVDVYFSDLPQGPGDTVTLYAYAEDSNASSNYWPIESDSGGYGIDVTIPSPTPPSIDSFSISSTDKNALTAEFRFRITDADSNGYTAVFYARAEGGRAYEKGRSEGAGTETKYITLSFDSRVNYEVYFELLDSNGDLVETSKSLFFDFTPTPATLDKFSYFNCDPKTKTIRVLIGVTDAEGSGWGIDVYASDRATSSTGTLLGSIGAASSVDQVSEFTVLDNKLYYVWGVFKPRVGSGTETTSKLEFDLRLPTLSNFRITTDQMTANFTWDVSMDVTGYDYVLWIKREGDRDYDGSFHPSSSSTSYSHTFTRTGTFYAHLVLYEDRTDAGTEISRVPSSGDKSFVIEYSVTDFSWTSSELSAFNNNGATTTLTKSRWNMFIDYVNECVRYVNARDGTSHALLPSSVKVGADGILYASSFKSICQKIVDITGRNISGVTLSQIVKGNPVYGSYFVNILSHLKTYK